MLKRFLVLLVILFFACSLPSAFAGPGPAAKFRHADRNKDGVVDKKEMRMEKAWEHRHWIKERSKVNTPLEAKYDQNGDGWLEPYEVKEMLKDKYELIKTHGKAKVDTAIEAEYDTNNDGIIDEKEAEALIEDIKEIN
jgi:Ca2+-binding EF-hand superfamily protein